MHREAITNDAISFKGTINPRPANERKHERVPGREVPHVRVHLVPHALRSGGGSSRRNPGSLQRHAHGYSFTAEIHGAGMSA